MKKDKLAQIISSIDQDKEYSIYELLELKVFPQVKTFASYRYIISDDMRKEKRLKAKIKWAGTSKRYKIKGEHLISYLVNKYE